MIQGERLVVVMPAPWRRFFTRGLWTSEKRLPVALAATLSVTTLFVEGVLNYNWIYPFMGTDMIGNALVAVVLLVPVAGYIAAPRSTGWLRDLVIIIAFLCLLVSGLDGLLRLQNGRGYISRRLYPNLPIVLRWDPHLNVRGPTYGDLAEMVGDPRLREPRPLIFQTDAAGFRNTHRGDGIDLLVLGDSFGAGAGTTQDRTFTSLLETQYGRRVYSLSYPGSPYQEYINFLIESPSLSFHSNAQVLWVYYTGNDLIEDYGDIWDPAALPWQKGWKAWMTTYFNFRSSSPLSRQISTLRRHLFGDERAPSVTQRLLPDGRPILFLDMQEEQGLFSQTFVEHHPHFSKLERTMVAMQKRASDLGLEVTVLLIPTKGEVYRWILNRRERRPEDSIPSGFALAVLDVCQRLQMRCLDAKPYLAQESYRRFDSLGEFLYWRDDTHLNDHGHEALAAFIGREILGSVSHPRLSQVPGAGSD